MQICFIRDSVSLVMPVTPGSYKWANGKNMETINISQLGDVYRPWRPGRGFQGASTSSCRPRNTPGWRAGPGRTRSTTWTT